MNKISDLFTISQTEDISKFFIYCSDPPYTIKYIGPSYIDNMKYRQQTIANSDTCPFCGKDQENTDCVHTSDHDSQIIESWNCNSCQKNWKRIYKFETIEE